MARGKEAGAVTRTTGDSQSMDAFLTTPKPMAWSAGGRIRRIRRAHCFVRSKADRLLACLRALSVGARGEVPRAVADAVTALPSVT